MVCEGTHIGRPLLEQVPRRVPEERPRVACGHGSHPQQRLHTIRSHMHMPSSSAVQGEGGISSTLRAAQTVFWARDALFDLVQPSRVGTLGEHRVRVENMLPGLFPRVGTSGLGLGQLCTPLCQAGALPAQCGVPEEDLLRRMKGRLPAVCNAVRLQRVWSGSGSVSRHTEQGAASRGGAPMKGSPPGACGIFRSTHDCHSQSRIAADAASPPHTQPPSQCIRVVSAAGSGGETGSGKQHPISWRCSWSGSTHCDCQRERLVGLGRP